jgi:GT2 family glycosyltransferase
MRISVIIVTYNGQVYIDKLFQSLLKAITPRLDVEIIVIDNGSTDNTLKFIEKYKETLGDKMKIIKLRKNLGFAGGNNAGLLFSSGDIAFLLNQDTYLDEKALATIHELFSKHPDIGVAQCLLLQYRYPNLLDSCGDLVSSAGFGIIGCWGAKRSELNLKEVKEIQLARGAALAVRKSILEVSKKIYGTYIPTYFVAGGYEDWFISFFARLLNYKVVLEPSCIVYHDSITPRKHNPHIIFSALSFFTEMKAPVKMYLGRVFFSIAFDLLLSKNRKNDTRALLTSSKAFILSVRKNISLRLYITSIAKLNRTTITNFWKKREKAGIWLRWYLFYQNTSKYLHKK